MPVKHPVIFLALSAPFLKAVDLYLSPTGSDTNPGTLAAPWQTFSKAVTAINAGDTLFRSARWWNRCR